MALCRTNRKKNISKEHFQLGVTFTFLSYVRRMAEAVGKLLGKSASMLCRQIVLRGSVADQVCGMLFNLFGSNEQCCVFTYESDVGLRTKRYTAARSPANTI
jgi:hypothetical protein